MCGKVLFEKCIYWKLPQHQWWESRLLLAHAHTRANTHADAHFTLFLYFPPHIQISQTHYCTSESKHQLSDISHGRNIFALTLVRDVYCPVCSEAPLGYVQQTSAARESSALHLMVTVRPWSIWILRSAERDGCSAGCFSHLTLTVGLAFEHPQESFFSCLPADLFVSDLRVDLSSACESLPATNSHHSLISKQQHGTHTNTSTKKSTH